MFERFTERSINVITLAQENAKALNNTEILPEHLLLGIIEQPSGIASRFLRVAGLTQEILQEKLNVTLEKGENSNQQILPFSNSVKKILTKAWDKALAMDVYYINPAHLFLALVENDENIPHLLKEFDINLERIIDSVKRVVEKRAKNQEHPESLNKNLRSNFSAEESILKEKFVYDLIKNAQNKLKETNFENLGTEQLLLAMLENQEQDIFKTLKAEGISKESVSNKINEINSRKDEYQKVKCSFTPEASKAVNAAYDIAKELGSATILPEHILLGILKEESGLAYRLLKDFRINTEDLYEKLLRPIEKQKPETLTIIRLAKEESRRLGHNTVGTELILLGILVEGSSMGHNVLKSLGVTVKDARVQVEKILGYGDNYQEAEISLTPRAKKLLEIAWEKAQKYNRPRIEAIHLLLGITKQNDCVAMKVLENLGVDVLEIRQGILKELNI
ncbi:MAG: Clp protease N-terminal domain-containing protein [Candidatus Gastranaerophilales bacterium]|nr:Clp protease N-terminal domain-containing protein [Candidatus Gastranaerophilales bacterium]